ncbi:hypothetical protein Y032_0028g1663 [Ancylostoma ceylanicum]|uniref:Uncharacterized protein n=1 Tax=Ancylostoma ceylanicum TaxID=53326 RepID=A0A016UT21_9BILA|nr:hypothetical protein Y032_0028g1663 [Ancylostoma ceylanicum]
MGEQVSELQSKMTICPASLGWFIFPSYSTLLMAIIEANKAFQSVHDSVLTPLQRRRYGSQSNPVRGVSRKGSPVNRWKDNVIPYLLSAQYTEEHQLIPTVDHRTVPVYSSGLRDLPFDRALEMAMQHFKGWRGFLDPNRKSSQERGKDMRRGLIGTLALAIFGMAVIGSITTNLAEVEVEPAEVAVVEKVPTDTLRLFLVGDTGGLPIYPYYSYAQKVVAKSMENMALEKKVQMVLNVGDNIYYTGVSDEYDSRFRWYNFYLSSCAMRIQQANARLDPPRKAEPGKLINNQLIRGAIKLAIKIEPTI